MINASQLTTDWHFLSQYYLVIAPCTSKKQTLFLSLIDDIQFKIKVVQLLLSGPCTLYQHHVNRANNMITIGSKV